MQDFALSKRMSKAVRDLLILAEDMEVMLSGVDYFTRMASFKECNDLDRYQIEAGKYCEDARKQLAGFDRELANLMVLRGRLAEVTDIPMFSHIGEDQRFPDRDEYDM